MHLLILTKAAYNRKRKRWGNWKGVNAPRELGSQDDYSMPLLKSKMHHSSRPFQTIYAIMRYSQEVSKCPFSQRGCIKDERSITPCWGPLLEGVNSATLQGSWYNSISRQEWVEESHFCKGYFCALFAITSTDVLRFASHGQPSGFRNYAWAKNELRSVYFAGGKRGKWEVKFIQNLKIRNTEFPVCFPCHLDFATSKEGKKNKVLLKKMSFFINKVPE